MRKKNIHQILYFYWNEHGGLRSGGLSRKSMFFTLADMIVTAEELVEKWVV